MLTRAEADSELQLFMLNLNLHVRRVITCTKGTLYSG